jgi:lysophospholipase L1-like esterase
MRICFIGDSFVNGTGDPGCLGWTGRLCREANADGFRVTYYNLGVRGNTSADIRDRWLEEVRARSRHEEIFAMVFSFGANDTTIENGATRVPFEESLANAGMIAMTSSIVYPTLFVGPPPIGDDEQNERIERLSDAMMVICADAGVPFLPAFRVMRKSDVWMKEVAMTDGAHPGAGGYEALAAHVAAWRPWKELLGKTDCTTGGEI